MFTRKHNLVALVLAMSIPTLMAVVLAGNEPASTAPDFVVRFEFDSDAIASADRVQLAAAARWLRDHPDHNLVVEAHTDAIGARTYNADLADRRAATVRAILRLEGADPTRVIKVICGEGRSLGASKAADRRVVLYATALDFHGLVSVTPEPCYPVVI